MGTSVISSELGWLLHMTMTNEWKGDTSWFYHEIKSVCEKSLLKLPPGDRGGASRADQCRWPEGCSLSGSCILNIAVFFRSGQVKTGDDKNFGNGFFSHSDLIFTWGCTQELWWLEEILQCQRCKAPPSFPRCLTPSNLGSRNPDVFTKTLSVKSLLVYLGSVCLFHGYIFKHLG